MGTEFLGFNMGNSFFNPIVFENANEPTTDVTFVGRFVDINPVGGLNYCTFQIEVPINYIPYTIVGMNGYLINGPEGEDVDMWNNNFQLVGSAITNQSSYNIVFYVSGSAIGLQMYFYLTMAKI
jgi:hypothetical protein